MKIGDSVAIAGFNLLAINVFGRKRRKLGDLLVRMCMQGHYVYGMVLLQEYHLSHGELWIQSQSEDTDLISLGQKHLLGIFFLLRRRGHQRDI